MYFKALLAHDDVVSESVFLVAPAFHVAQQAAQLLYPDSRLVWMFPVDDEDVPSNVRGSAEETTHEMLRIARGD
ncbi:hypothetical protein [Burkholderia lata]|uniref:hypothetical protein n=1 Tax=Burkholderia lata (strain ATCC 17760 / DSM 23089 / LMG 22485 / NCIMB 9086 / R18194 / 383) TaxID=482957 RepID=UPI0015822F8C|nr:hypothetical protein [Burkholderia lata]